MPADPSAGAEWSSPWLRLRRGRDAWSDMNDMPWTCHRRTAAVWDLREAKRIRIHGASLPVRGALHHLGNDRWAHRRGATQKLYGELEDLIAGEAHPWIPLREFWLWVEVDYDEEGRPDAG